MTQYRIYRTDNYIFVVDNNTQETQYGFVKEVFIDKSNKNVAAYRIFNVKDFDDKVSLPIAQILKEDGSAYTIAEFETFYTQNTGNFNGGGGSPGVQSVTGTEVDNSDPQNPVITTVNTPDATTTVKGKVKLAGDLAGTAELPTVPGLLTKQATLVSGTNIKTLEGQTLLGSGNIDLTKSDVGLSSVDNTTDLNKPISTATQTALNLKENLSNKQNSLTTDGSGIKYPTVDAVNSALSNLSIPVPVAKGIIYNQSTWANLSDFNVLGNATASISSGKILMGTTTPGNYNDAITLKTPTGLDKWKITCEIKVVNVPGTTTYGMGLGIKSRNSISANKFQTLARMDMSSIATKGTTFIDYGGNTYTNAITDSTAFNFVQNDVLRFVLEQDVNKITLNVFNLTTNVKKATSLTYIISNSQPFPSNAGDFAIHVFGGTYEMSLFKVETKAWEKAQMMCIGDSKTNGFNADTFKGSFVQQLNDLYGGIHNNSGGNDKTAEVLLKIPEIISFAPKKVLLNIGSNDKRNGISFATWSANYASIVSQLISAGIDVYHLLQLNETVLDFTDYNTYITTNYSASKIIDAGRVSLESSGVHPDQNGMNQVFMAIIAKIRDFKSINNSGTVDDLVKINNTLTKIASYTVLLSDFVNNNTLVIYADATSGNITITLPNASTFTNYEVIVKKTDVSLNSITITGNANIDGASTLIVSSQYSKAKVTSNGTQYFIL